MTSDPPDPGAPRILGLTPDLLALYKPAGLHTFGPDSLASWLIRAEPDLAGVGPAGTPALVHRLDRGTSGLILAARSVRAHESLRAAFAAKRIEKTYLALVEGLIEAPTVVEVGLGARYRRSKRVWPDLGRTKLRGVRPARSEIEPLGTAAGLTLCLVRMRTGVRHQIRAHLAHLGLPICGDRAYGATGDNPLEDGVFFLHAGVLGLPAGSGAGSEPARWTCPLPADRWRWLERIDLAQATPKDFRIA